MSKNIDQVYNTNPITTNVSTDLMYFGRSPYGAGDDAAMTYSNFSAQFPPLGGVVLLAPSGNQTITGAHNLIMATGEMIAPTMLPGNLSLSVDTISTTNTNGTLIFQPNGSGNINLNSTDQTNAAVYIGPQTVDYQSQHGRLYISHSNANSSIYNTCFFNAISSSAQLNLLKSRSPTPGSNVAVQSGDTLGQIVFKGDTGSTFSIAGIIEGVVGNALSGSNVPGNLVFATSSTSSTAQIAMTIDYNQIVTLVNPLLGESGGTGIDNSGLTINLGSGSTGLVLTSDSSGNATWQSATSGLQAPVARYVVSQLSGASPYSTIQSAIDQAVSDGASSSTPATVWIWPGTYVEDLTLADYVNLAAANSSSPSGVFITGNAIYGGSAIVSIDNVSFSTKNVSAAFSVTTGGSPSTVYCNSVYFDSGSASGTAFVYGSTSSTVNFTDCNFNSATGGKCLNIETTPGTINFYTCVFNAVDTQSTIDGATVSYNNCVINDSVAVAFTASIAVYNSTMTSIDFPCVTFSGTTVGLFINVVMDSATVTNYILSGTASTIEYENLTATGPATLIDPGLSAIGLPTLVGNVSFDGGTTILSSDGQVWIGSSVGNPAPATLTAGSNISITNGANSITISSSAGGATSTTYVNSSPYTVLTTDDVILMDTLLYSAPMSVVLLASPAVDGQVWTVKDWSGQASAFNITVTVAASANTIDGASSFVLSTDYESVSFVYSVSEGTYSVINEANAGGSVSLISDSGTVVGSSINVQAFSDPNFPNRSGSSVTFFADTTTTPQTLVFSLSDNNLNTLLGTSSGNTSVSGSENVGVGALSFANISSASNNVGVGYSSFGGLLTGTYNIAVGYGAGDNYSGSETANILLASGGVTGESNVMRLGNTTGTGSFGVNLTYICGIQGSTPTSANTPQVMLCDNTDNVTVINSSTAGFVLTSNGTATPSFQAPAGSIIWSDQATSFSAVSGNGYIATAALTATLPIGTAVGETISFIVDTTGSFVIQAPGGQTIRLGSLSSSSGGTATNNAQGDTITLIYSDSSSSWISLNDEGNAWNLV